MGGGGGDQSRGISFGSLAILLRKPPTSCIASYICSINRDQGFQFIPIYSDLVPVN